jgi:hypothetical protein
MKQQSLSRTCQLHHAHQLGDPCLGLVGLTEMWNWVNNHARKCLVLEPDNAGVYAVFLNIYVAAGMPDQVQFLSI